MAPNPQTVITDREISPEIQSRVMTGEEIVISGMSGIFPNCGNTLELMENLYNKVDMVKEVTCDTYKHPALPKHIGRMPNREKFDAQFFRVTPWQAASLDPLTRKALENAYSAIYDSGINPLSLSGTKLGVFMGSSYGDIMTINLFEVYRPDDFVVSGCSKSMMANRISYWIDAKGPSFTVDNGCASSMICFESAYNSIKQGLCDAAIVGGANACLHPALSIVLKNTGHLCLDGKNKSFDKNGDGYVRSEAVSLFFLQKSKDAKRIYTEIYHIKGKFFTRPDANFLPMRNIEDMANFLEEFYSEVKVSPFEVEFVEAFGSGIAEADGNELEAIGRFFARSKSIKVGSVKSNMGNTESASGACSVAKMCLAYQKGELPANLHYNDPQDHISSIRNGRLQVVTENTPFNRGFTAVNNYSYAGGNYHLLLKGVYKNKDKKRYITNLPRIILLSGRDEQCINKVLDRLQSQPIDPEQIALLHNIYKDNIPGHTGRSYIVLDTNEKKETVSLARSFQFYSGATRPLCFLYSGMGSQWNGMGTELMRIPVFAAAIERCRKALEPLDMDLVKILIDQDKTIFDSIINSMVGICAIQIGLTDVLKSMGIVPDIIIGHSIGEIGCAYADGCLTAEEMILASCYRGSISEQKTVIRGSMAAVGLGYKDILPLCPPEIEVACHNSAESATISGPIEAMNKFVSDLTSRGIFAKEVACSNIAYHSKYVASAGPALLTSMRKLIKEPKLRSDKWISTSVPQDNWDKDIGKFASAEYFTENLLNPVLFEENASLIPKDAVIIEIAPHGLMQAIMKRSHTECLNIPLTKRACPDPVLFFLEAVGKVYQTGLNTRVDVLYPKVEFPVSTETPLLSPLVEFEHSVDWPQPVHDMLTEKESSAQNFVISIHDDDYKYMEGYVRNGINEIPETAILVFVWKTFGKYSGKYYKDMSVTFYDVTFHCQLKIEREDVLRFTVTFKHSSNRFEVINGNTLILTGSIKDAANIVSSKSNIDYNVNQNQIRGQDVYTLFRMKGYSYGEDFQTIHSLNNTHNTAYIKWTGEWTTFLDSLLQLKAYARDHDGVSTPKIIEKLSINVDQHKNKDTTVFHDVTCYEAEILQSTSGIRCGGVEVRGVVFDDKLRLEKQPDVLLVRDFIPHELKDCIPLETAIFINLQLVADNVENNKVKLLELLNPSSEAISNIVQDLSIKLPSSQVDVKKVEINDNNIHIQDVINSNLLVARNLLGRIKMLNILNQELKDGTFVLTLEQNMCHIQNTDLIVISIISVESGLLVLLKKVDKRNRGNVTYIPIDQDNKFSWYPQVLKELKKMRWVILVSERQPQCGLLGIVKSLRKNGKNNISLMIVDDYRESSFDPLNDIFKEQLNKQLAFNILKKGQWGGYYYVPNSEPRKIQNMALTSTTVGNLDNFSWVEITEKTENQIQVSYAGISSKDCQKVLGNTSYGKVSFGVDYSGIDNNGKRVMGMVASGALSRTVEADSMLTWPIPQHWTLQDAATVPLPYVHAYYCLVLKGNIKEKQRIFINGGAGALGQAVISICLGMNCEVFTTVSSEKKKILLLKLFPKLKDENIAYSRHESFFMQVKTLTRDKRCDIVINSSSGSLREAAMSCVALMGRFLDVSNVDIEANREFRMFYLEEDKHYEVVNISYLFKPVNLNERKILQSLMAKGIANGTVRPLSRVVYSPLEVSRAFKLVSSSRHIGRALIRMSETELLSSKLNVTPSVTFSNGVSIVICDKNNLGIELSNNLIKKGGSKIILNLNKSSSHYYYARAKLWEKLNVTIELHSENLQTVSGCEKLLKAGQKLGSVTSIFIVQDYKEKIDCNNFDQDDFQSSYDETVRVTANLDIASRNSCHELSNFVIVSALSENIDSDYATSACETICEDRKKIGLPALVLRTIFPDKIIQNKTNLLLKLEESTLSSLFNAMDISLKYKYTNTLIFNLPNITTSAIFEKIQRILGAHGVNCDDETLTLYKMNVNDIIIDELKSELSQITKSTSDLGQMTVASLKNLCNSYKRKNTMFEAGMGAFYYNIEQDESKILEAYFPLKTQLIRCVGDGYVDRSKNELIMIPGFDGHHQIFKSLAERLKIRATALELGPGIMCNSIPEIAKQFKNIIKSQFATYPKFYILGYSFGVNVALEVAKLLEAEGRTGVVYCLDSSPEALKSQLKAYLGNNFMDAQLQNAVLAHMYNLMTGQEGVELILELEKAASWPDKVEICMKRLQGLVNFSIGHRRSILESVYKKILLANEYEPDFKLESELVLMKGIPHPKAESLAEDYNLSKYSKQPVKVFYIESDHVAAPYDNRVSNIVNKMLDPNVLEEFERRKLC